MQTHVIQNVSHHEPPALQPSAPLDRQQEKTPILQQLKKEYPEPPAKVAKAAERLYVIGNYNGL